MRVRLASLVNASGTRTISYDGRGNTIGESRPGGGTVATSYDGYGRLLSYVRSGDPAQANAYNGLDERVGATSGSVTHELVYDPDGRLMGEYDSSGAPVAETIWLSPDAANDNQPFSGDDGVGGYAPLAVATGSGSATALYWVHGNHLGVPIVTTDASGAAATPPAYTMAGFPGQTHTLSDLYYNRYLRPLDVVPSVAAAIGSDPPSAGLCPSVLSSSVPSSSVAVAVCAIPVCRGGGLERSRRHASKSRRNCSSRSRRYSA